MQQTAEEADAQAHDGDNDEHQQQRIAGNGGTNSTGPADGSGEDVSDIRDQRRDSNRSSLKKNLLSKK